MSNRSLFFLAVVALGFCAYLYFKGGEPGTREREEEAQRLVILKPEEIQRIELTNPGGTYVFQKTGDEKWEMEKPIKFPVDPAAIGALLSDLEFTQKKRVIQSGELPDYQAALQQFGLKDPLITARFQTGREAVDLQIGGKTPSGNLYYAMVRDPKKQELAVVEEGLQTQLMQNLDQWRNPQVFDFKNSETSALVLRKGAQEVEVLKEGKIWNVTKPLKVEAVQKRIQSYLSLLANLKAENFASETNADPSLYGLNSPAFTLELKLHDRSQILRVGKAKADQPEQVYAQFGDRPAVFTLPAKVADVLASLLDEIRPRELFDIAEGDQVRTIEIMQGSGALVLQKKEGEDGDWMVRGDGVERKASALAASDIIQAMQVLEARTFYASVDNPPAEYGLQKPGVTVKVSGREGEAKDKAFERKVIFGALKDNFYFAESSALPFVVDVDRKFVDALPKGVFGWFDRSLGMPPEDEMTTLAWVQGGRRLYLSKNNEGKWVSDPADKVVDEKFLKVQLSFLSGLKALRWVGHASKKDFAKPRFALEVGAGARGRKLLFGPKQSDGTTLAKMADDDYAFALTDEDAQKVMVEPIFSAP